MPETTDDDVVENFSIDIRTALVDDTYTLIMDIGPDEAIQLSTQMARDWGLAVTAAVANAAYDSAVATQLTNMKDMPDSTIARMLMDMRHQRYAFQPVLSVGDLSLHPGVSHKTMEPFLMIYHRGEPIGSWTLEDARDHAFMILMSAEIALLDQTYRQTLIHTECPEDLARTMVATLKVHFCD